MFQHFQFNTAMLTIIHKACLLRIINCLPFARIYVHPQVFGGSLSCSSSQFFGGSLSCSSSQFFWRESELLVISVFWRESELLIVWVFLVGVWVAHRLSFFLAGVWVAHRLSFFMGVWVARRVSFLVGVWVANRPKFFGGSLSCSSSQFSVLCYFCFVRLRSMSCAQCCMCLWIVNSLF